MSHHIIQNVFQALASNDPDRICAVLTEDAEWLSPPGNATALALDATHHMVGRNAIVRFFAEDFPACSCVTSRFPSTGPTPTASG
ncbi:nuclear transport factor 2 family protein [Streptomyces sp. NPDC050147]|uniref:nuclear transport factor 2 family protein n=1 Tax=Streptomyces sp. NPDC050147 TaxID=3155513 RepID=UPI00341A18CA